MTTVQAPTDNFSAVISLRRNTARSLFMAASTAPRGLQDVVANDSSICFIDGGKGILSYRGIDIHELASKSSFEETAYLLWNGKLPTSAELNDFSHLLADARQLPEEVIAFLGKLPKTASPMEVLRTAVS